MKSNDSDHGKFYYESCNGLKAAEQWFCNHLMNHRFNNRGQKVTKLDRLYRTLVERNLESEYLSELNYLNRSIISVT